MFKKNAFTLTIGNEGALLVLHEDKKTKNKILIEQKLNPAIQEEIKKLLYQYRETPLYILLDNAEQNYTKKSYPSVNRLDLNQIIQRHIKQEFSQTGEDVDKTLYNYMAKKSKRSRKWECMYVSTIYFEGMQSWIDFLVKEAPNHIVGIYMLPVETVNLIKKFHIANNEDRSKKSDPGSAEKITLLITRNKVSGFRQIIFSDERIIFTRLTQYDYENENFVVNFEQDIFRTNEYLKRILPNLKLEDMEIINILPRKILEKIETIKNKEINFTNFTPREFANKIGHTNLLPKNSQFSDILISNIFNNSKKELKSVNTRIKSLNIYHTITKILAGINIVFLICVIIYAIFIQTEESRNAKSVLKLTKNKAASEKALQVVRQDAVGAQDKNISVNIDEVIEFGIFDELMENNKINPVILFEKLNFGLKEVSIKSIYFSNSYSIKKKKEEFSFNIDGNLKNENGDVENLFKIYDNFVLKVNENFKGYEVQISELQKNIDFTKKYFNTTFKINVKSK